MAFTSCSLIRCFFPGTRCFRCCCQIGKRGGSTGAFFFRTRHLFLRFWIFTPTALFFFFFHFEKKKQKVNTTSLPYKFTYVFSPSFFFFFFFRTFKIDSDATTLPYKLTCVFFFLSFFFFFGYSTFV